MWVQLVKSGADDLRQDAVMQQFFALVNSFLAASAPTRQRSLRITIYKVQASHVGLRRLGRVGSLSPRSSSCTLLQQCTATLMDGCTLDRAARAVLRLHQAALSGCVRADTTWRCM